MWPSPPHLAGLRSRDLWARKLGTDHAAWACSLIRPPRIGRRWILPVSLRGPAGCETLLASPESSASWQRSPTTAWRPPSSCFPLVGAITLALIVDEIVRRRVQKRTGPA